ncbi:hypothetical protein D0T53_00955 [Dysgonomonas sp. 216]|uniref:hypothetical protein n=1 Tax=Dysgonomonas sp. 216 TaxID=2302934 RepID=UPI0013D33FDF|nr:hypothetical protein [Dysgonomonas sp. 216]NDW17481.1 hypothetical protein [Dysgonomonas sp. 216]
MKKIIVYSIIFFLVHILPTQAQDFKFSGNIMIEQNIPLNNQYKDKDINNTLRSMSTTFLAGRLNLQVTELLEIYGKIGLGVSKSGTDVNRFFNKYNEFNFDGHIFDLQVRNSRSSINHLTNQFSLGTSALLISSNKYSIRGGMGIGIEYMRAPKLSYTLKEEGTNVAYNISYTWFDSRRTAIETFFYDTELAISKTLSKKIDLRFTAAYKLYFPRSTFEYSVTNYYTDSLIKQYQQEGKTMHVISLSLGITIK